MLCSRHCKVKNAVAPVALLLCGLMLHAQTARSGITGVVIQVGHPGPSFTVSLPPGKYFITQSDPSLSRIHSEVFVVEKGKMTRVKIYADNGMR